LNYLKPVPGSGWKPESTCIPGTREHLLRSIIQWANEPTGTSPQVRWFCGVAGLGKSTVAHSVCQELDISGRLGASFFFSRDVTERNSANHLFATIAYQLAFKMPSYREHLCATLEQISVPSQAIRQLIDLLVKPLVASTPPIRPLIVVLDALDECVEEDRASFFHILASRATSLRPYIKFFVTSQPEVAIENSLRRITHSRLGIDLQGQSNLQDIQNYIENFMDTAVFKDGKRRPHWPSSQQRQDLANHARGLFAWASMACTFIRMGLDPERQLAVALSAQTSSNGPENHLHELYAKTFTYVSEQAWGPSFMTGFRFVVGAVIALKQPLSEAALSRLLEPGNPPVQNRVSAIVRSLGHVLHVDTPEDPIHTIHPSLNRYLSGGFAGSFSIDVGTQNTLLARRSLEIIHATLCRDICQIEHIADTPNAEISDLPRRLANFIPPEVVYACRFWAAHVLAADDAEILLSSIQRFYEEDLLHWTEVMSLHGRMREVNLILRSMELWIQSLLDAGAVTPNAATPFSSVLSLRSNPPGQSSAVDQAIRGLKRNIQKFSLRVRINGS
jgi:hypothetical protein